MQIEVLHDDITCVKVDAIVNAANERMLGGGGVDGAIHRAAGPELLEECFKVKEVSTGRRCPTGEARITPAGKLPAKYVIHTVGPVWEGGGADEETLLANCYRNSMALAEANGVESVAFPAISTGVFRFPVERATRIAVRETRGFLSSAGIVKRVLFVCFSPETVAIYQRELQQA